MNQTASAGRSQLSVKISRHLETEISEGRLKPGDRIPTEAQLTNQFGVSRNVVREAVARLKSEGLVESHQGRGAFVSDKAHRNSFRINHDDLSSLSKLRQLYELRLDLEVSAAGMAARRRTRSQLETIQAALAALHSSLSSGQSVIENSLAFKRAIADATGNEYFKNFVLFLTAHIFEAASFERRIENSAALRDTVLAEHASILEAIELGDPDLARRAAWVQIINSAERNGLRGLQGWEVTRMSSLGETYAPPCAPPIANMASPSLTLPENACDCHFHIFGDPAVYPFTPHRSYTPPPASLDAYQSMQRTLGLTRGVIVQPSVYGYDNRAILQALRQGGGNYRGVVVISPEASEAELREMDALGVRGVRINLIYKSGVEVSDVTHLARKIAPLGWHVQLLIDVSEFADLYDTLANLPVNVVIDHMGHMPASVGTEHPGIQDLLRLTQEGKVWVKLSGAYRFTNQRSTPYSDITPYAKALIESNPDQILWASDWPHVCISVPMPDDRTLIEEFFEWAGRDEATIRKILVDNPARLYGF
ncbi:amidohydrolase family protein [Stutzerimonas tarimensis]|uniref:Amidohydrolase family protein n=1 Tax=Stutzerimonas tarimensis TaxID=1507735 RepID=A0ABV7T0W7_9GAMM